MTDWRQGIESIVRTVWGAQLGLEAAPREASLRGEPRILASVLMVGDWCGELRIECTVPFARRAAEVLFARGDRSLEPADLDDAVGELANILSGSLKGWLRVGSSLSLPAVRRVKAGASADGAALAECAGFECEGERFLVAVTPRGSRS